MIKKILIILLILITSIFVVFKIYNNKSKTWYLEINKDSIKSIEIKKYGVYGLVEETIKDKKEINEIYDYLTNIKIGKETNASCDDNTKKYILNMDDDTTKIIEIECNTIIINNKKYSIK